MTGVYRHKVHYYETDQMGIVHHSNYIRWFEEARDDLTFRNGIDYREIEARGYMLAVVSVECRYRSPAKYGETVEIVTRLKSFNGARVVYEYEARREDGSVCVTGHSEHCFISAQSRAPVNLRRMLPEYAQQMMKLAETKNGGEK